MKFANQAELDAYIAKQVEEGTKAAVDAALEAEKKTAQKTVEPPPRDVKIEGGETAEEKVFKDKGGGFKGFGHFLKCIQIAEVQKTIPEELKRWIGAVKTAGTGLVEGIDEYGGYLNPDAYVAQIREVQEEAANFASLCFPVPIAGLTTLIPAVDDTTHASNFGGIVFYKVAETGDITATRPKLAMLRLTLDKHAGLCYISEEMLEDAAVPAESWLIRRFGMAWAWYQDGYLFSGDGAGEPVGAASSKNTALISVTRNTTGHISQEDISGIWARMHTFGKSRAVWVVNPDVLPEFDGMMLGTNTPLYMPPGGLSAAPYGTIKGRPVIETEHASAVGTGGDISLIDWGEYLLAKKAGYEGGPKMATSMHVKFIEGQTAFRFTVRFDGKPGWLSERTPKNGTSKSPFVTLAT